jgi:hypothetical protein
VNADVDYYDVQRMVEDSAAQLRARIDNLRADLNAALDELREEVASLGIVISSRTDHLA